MVLRDQGFLVADLFPRLGGDRPLVPVPGPVRQLAQGWEDEKVFHLQGYCLRGPGPVREMGFREMVRVARP